MIDKILPRPASPLSQAVTSSQCDTWEPEQYFCHTAEHDPVNPRSATTYEIAARKLQVRTLIFWAIMAAVVTTSLVLGARSLFLAPLETRVITEQARSLAKDVDTVVKARCAAVHVAAGSLDIDNLSASGGLERLLRDVKAILPDFSSLEIINDEGQSVAIMGNVALSIIGQPVDRQALASIESGEPLQRVLFVDDPANQGFFIILSHTTADGRQWFSRTRFSRKPIDAILKSEAALQATLLPLSSESVADSSAVSASSGAGQSTAVAAIPAVRVTKRWYGETKAAEADLLTPGWTLSLENQTSLAYFGQVLIPGVLALIIGIIYQVARTRSRDAEIQPESAAVVRTSPEVVAESEEPVVQHSVETDLPDSAEKVSGSAIEEPETFTEIQSEYFGCEVPSEPCEVSACVEESDPVDEIPETLEVAWLETVSVEPEESQDSQQEQITPDVQPHYVIASP